MPFIYSTLTCSNSFAIYAPKTDPRALSRIDTPMGVVTRVTDEELELLQQDLTFQQQVKDGFIVVDNKKTDPAKKAADMSQKDASAPLTPKDFEKSEDSEPELPIYRKKGK